MNTHLEKGQIRVHQGVAGKSGSQRGLLRRGPESTPGATAWLPRGPDHLPQVQGNLRAGLHYAPGTCGYCPILRGRTVSPLHGPSCLPGADPGPLETRAPHRRVPGSGWRDRKRGPREPSTPSCSSERQGPRVRCSPFTELLPPPVASTLTRMPMSPEC